MANFEIGSAIGSLTESEFGAAIVKSHELQLRNTASASTNGPNILGGYSSNSIDSASQGNFVAGGIQGNTNHIGLSFTGKNGGPNDTYIAGTADYCATLGYDNIVNGLASIVMSQHTRIYTAATHIGVLGGSNHNVVDGDYHGIVGGTLNSISSTGQSIGMVGSALCTASGTVAGVAFVGANDCDATSGNYSAAVGAYQCTLSAESSAVIAANNCSTSAPYTLATGLRTTGTIYGSINIGCRIHSVAGDSQAISWHESQSSTDAGTTDLSPFGSANLISIPINTTWAGSLYVVGRRTSNGARSAYKCDFVVSKASSGNVIVDYQNWTEMFNGISITTPPAINPSASSVFRVRCTGIASAGTIRWSSRIDMISLTA